MPKTQLAYLDVMSGLIPCKLLRFERCKSWPDNGVIMAVIQYTSDRGSHRKGVMDSWSARMVIPRDKVKIRRNGRHLILAYDWADYGVSIPA